MADTVEEIKSRLGIYDVVSQYVQLKKAGRNYKGLCPFHSEKTPSFVVSPEKQICHCFGCNKGGDIFNFIEEVEGVSFSEALQVLADKAGVKIDNISKFSKKENKGEKELYFKAHDLAADFFSKQLFKTSDGKKVLTYLKKRGISEATIKEFKVGFAPNEFNALYPMLLKKGISKKILLKSGFINSKGIGEDEIYDKFRGRLMFPIFDYMGRICGFGGRALKKDQMPKYLNSPENMIYNKSKLLYGLSHAKEFIKKEDQIVLVEGYFDVIMPYQEGVKNIVAVSGTALTSDQVRLIKRLTTNAVTCFDQDTAGFEATKRSYELLKKEEMIVKTVEAFDSKDPAELVNKEGSETFKKLIIGAPNFVSVYMKRLIDSHDMNKFEERKKMLKSLLPLLKQMSSADKDYYVRELSKHLNTKEQYIYDEIEMFKLPKDHPALANYSDAKPGSVQRVEFGLMDMIIGLILYSPKLFSQFEKSVEKIELSGPYKDIYKALSSQYNSARTNLEQWDTKKGLLAQVGEKVDVLQLYGEERYGGLSEESLETELNKLVDKILKERGYNRLKDLQSRIVEAEKDNDKDTLLKLLSEQQDLLSKQYGKD